MTYETNNGTREQVLLQVERFLERGGSAHVYQVKLLQHLGYSSGTSAADTQQAPVATAAATWSAAAASVASSARAGSSALKVRMKRAAAATAKALDESLWYKPLAASASPSSLQEGQSYVIKIPRTMESHPAEQLKGVSRKRYLTVMGEALQKEWEVLQEFSECSYVIDTYGFGYAAAAAAATAAAGKAAKPLALPCIIMEYADGGSAWSAVYQQQGDPQPLPAAEAWHVMRDAASALQELHDEGYIHHDIKLDNMLRINRGEGSPREELALQAAADAICRN
jgi:serine/threonine protein kinase